MALVDDCHMFYPAPPLIYGGTSIWRTQAILLDASGDKYGAVFQAPKTGNISDIHFRTGTVTTGGNFDCRVETVELTNGNPSGTLFGTNTNASVTIADTDDNVWKSAALTASAAVTKGDLIAVSIVAPASVSANLLAIENLAPGNFPYFLSDAGAGWVKAGHFPILVVEYDDASFAYTPGVIPAFPYIVSYSTTTGAADERGTKITVPFKCRVVGYWSYTDPNDADFTVKLYDDADVLLASLDVDGNTDRTSGHTWDQRMFETPVTLDAGDVVRLTTLATTATTVSSAELSLYSDAAGAQLGAGTNAVFTARNEGGAWSDVTSLRFMAGLVIDQVDDGTGGGGGSTVYTGIIG